MLSSNREYEQSENDEEIMAVEMEENQDIAALRVSSKAGPS